MKAGCLNRLKQKMKGAFYGLCPRCSRAFERADMPRHP